MLLCITFIRSIFGKLNFINEKIDLKEHNKISGNFFKSKIKLEDLLTFQIYNPDSLVVMNNLFNKKV